MLELRSYSRRPRRDNGSGALFIISMLAVLASLVTFSPAAAAAESSSEREALIAALEALKKAVNDKIASDIDDVAWALWSVHQIEDARFLADLLGAPLTVIQQSIATLAAIKNVQDVEAGLRNAPDTLGFLAYAVGLGLRSYKVHGRSASSSAPPSSGSWLPPLGS